jgi:GRIP and coiled-coil domain-containing protein 2
LIQENSTLKENMLELPKDQLKIRYDKCIEKLKVYREKINTISENLIVLKTDKEILLKTTKEYSRCISEWQTDLVKATVAMAEKINDSTMQLRLKKEENEELRQKIAFLQGNETIINDLKQEMEHLKEMLAKKDKEISEEKDASKKNKKITKKRSL